jgi:anti-anti-sigma factor
MGHFELFARSLATDLQARAPARRVPVRQLAERRVGPQIEQTALWAESRRISIRGELDGAGAGALQRIFVETIGAGFPCVVLDLCRCEFLDAAALGVIARAHDRLAAHGQELIVEGANGQVERLIGLASAISLEVRLNRVGIGPPSGRPGVSAAIGNAPRSEPRRGFRPPRTDPYPGAEPPLRGLETWPSAP